MRLRTAARAASTILIISASLFSCKPPRTSILEEGARDMGKPQVVTKVEEDAETPREKLDTGNLKVVPGKKKLPGQVELPPKPVRIPLKGLGPIVKDHPDGELTIYPNGMRVLKTNDGTIKVLKLPDKEIRKVAPIK